MAIKQAGILTEKQVARLLADVAEHSTDPVMDRLTFLLSYKAGLRVQEIAGLRWNVHILDADGKIRFREELVPGSQGRIKRVNRHYLTVTEDISKYGSTRTVPMHDMIVVALQDALPRAAESSWVIPSRKNASTQDLKSRAHALCMRINRMYKRMGFSDCSTHSGRRTFITKAAQRANLAGCSIRDVQLLAGHKNMGTTEKYIAASATQADLVSML